MKLLVSIIIVNWNGMRWLPECFGSLSEQNYKNYEIIFVDNASKDQDNGRRDHSRSATDWLHQSLRC